MNSASSDTINHKGIVQSADRKSVIVTISSATACSGCHAENSCNISGNKDKIIEVRGNYNVEPGDSVTVYMKQSMGYTALFYGYLLPMISVIALLIVLVSFKMSELASGLISLGILIPYYIILYLFKSRINDKFRFTLKTTNNESYSSDNYY
jgi:sigma-E factor negative regulatory protein RseC